MGQLKRAIREPHALPLSCMKENFPGKCRNSVHCKKCQRVSLAICNADYCSHYPSKLFQEWSHYLHDTLGFNGKWRGKHLDNIACLFSSRTLLWEDPWLSIHSQNWYARWGWRFHFEVLAESFPSWVQFCGVIQWEWIQQYSFSSRYLLDDKPLLFIINCNGIYFSSQERIAYFLTEEAVHLLIHFKFLRV